MKAGRKLKASRGGFAGGRPPFGYRVLRGALEVDVGRSETVRRVFDLKRTKRRTTLQEIADTLNGEGRRTAEGKLFARVHIKRILDRKAVYRGETYYEGKMIEGRHEAILESSTA